MKSSPGPGALTERVGFSHLRYAQCWEDADVLLDALDVRPGDTCLSIASAGDNSLSLLTRDPAKVVAIDVSQPQLACLELKVAAYRTLEHHELLELVGSRPSTGRRALYSRCRPSLSADARTFWDARPASIEEGIGSSGKLERYLAFFRRRVLPLVHRRSRIERLLQGGSVELRESFYRNHWNTWPWQLVFALFFSRPVLGRAGRDPEFFRHVRTNVAGEMLARTRRALIDLDPSANPYVHWILSGRHGDALPHALREENFESIRARLDRLEWRRASLDEYLQSCPADSIQRFNLSDIFEYMSEAEYARALEEVSRVGGSSGRVAYWNLFVDRRRPASLAGRLRPLDTMATRLHQQDKAFFYARFVVEEVA